MSLELGRSLLVAPCPNCSLLGSRLRRSAPESAPGSGNLLPGWLPGWGACSRVGSRVGGAAPGLAPGFGGLLPGWLPGSRVSSLVGSWVEACSLVDNEVSGDLSESACSAWEALPRNAFCCASRRWGGLGGGKTSEKRMRMRMRKVRDGQEDTDSHWRARPSEVEPFWLSGLRQLSSLSLPSLAANNLSQPVCRCLFGSRAFGGRAFLALGPSAT